MRKLSNRVIACLLCALCLFALCPVRANAADAIDLSRDVRLSIAYTHGREAVSGVRFDLYYVAVVDTDGTFSLAGDFRKYPVEVNGLSAEEWRALAEMLAVYADRDQLQPLDSGTTDGEGALSFPNGQGSMKPGLYLAVGRKLVKDGYTYTTEPFLAALPSLNGENDTWMYDVEAIPKHLREQNPEEPSEETVERKVLKVWKDDVQQFRPRKVTIQLLRDGVVYDTVVLNEENNWRYTWETLPKYNADGSKIQWTVAEKALRNYKVLITREGVTFVVTNTYSFQETTELTRTVLKLWDDKGYEKLRPGSIMVTLLRNGQVYDTQILKAANSWQYTWKDLPKYDDDDNRISWTIREEAVNGYVTTVRQTGDVYVITNSIDKRKLPQTGALWWPVPILAAAGLAFLAAGLLSGKKKNHD